MKNSIIKRTISLILTVSFVFTFTQLSTVLAVEEDWKVDLVTEVTMPEAASDKLVEDKEQVKFPVETVGEDIQSEEISASDEVEPFATRKPYEVVDVLPSQLQKMESQSATYSTTTSSSYDGRTLYSINMLQQNMYNPKVSQDLTINAETGNTGYTYNIASIPGKNGSVMSLSVEYNSTESKFALYLADITDARDYYIEPYIEYDSDENLGAGWKFSGLKRRHSDRYYTLRDGRVVNIYDIDASDYEDYTIENSVITYIDGTKEGISGDYLSYVEDKYGNRVTYTYETYTKSSGEEDLRLISIQDNLNRTIEIDYYDTYVEITRPDSTKVRLNRTSITKDMSSVAEERDLETTSVTGKVISSIYNVTDSQTIAQFGYDSIFFRYVFAPAGISILEDGSVEATMADDWGVFAPMTSCTGAFHASHYIDYEIVADNSSFPSVPSANTKNWYLCAVKDYTTSAKIEWRSSYSYEITGGQNSNNQRTGTQVTANNAVIKTTTTNTTHLQEIYERNGSVDTLKQSTSSTYRKDNRQRPLTITSKVYNSNGNYITDLTTNTYSDYGKVLTSTNKVDGVVRIETVNTYYSDIYKSLKDSTVKKGTTVFNKTAYDVNTYGDVTYERVYDGSGVLQRKTYYEYLSNNLVGKTMYDGDTTTILQKESYSYTGAYMTYAYVFDNSYNIISEISYTYDNNTGRVLTTTDANTKETIQYDSLGRVTKETHKDGTYAEVTYVPQANVVCVTDEKGYYNEYYYNNQGLLQSVDELNASNSYTTLQTITYDAVGNPVTVKDALNNTTTITYDALGRQMSVKQPGNSVTAKAKYLDVILEGSTKYSVYLTISETGRISCEYYDVYGRLVKTALIKNYSSFTESSFNNIYQMPSNAELVITSRYVYDDLDRVIEQYDGENRPTYYTYDSMGNVINMKQGLATADDPQININYEYDSAGNLVKTTQGTHITTYEYDYAGRLTKMTDPMNYTETYTYDTAGNVKTSKDKNGVTTTNTYNNRGLLSKTAKGSEYIEYTYDAVGNILTSKDKNGIISYTYNYDGTPATKTYPDGKSIIYDTYNANKALTAMTDYLGNTTTYTYNSKGAVTAMGEKYSGTTSTKTTSYAYNTDGSLQKVTYPLSSTTTTTYTYDYAGRVSNLTNKLTSSSTYSTHAYTYDNSGNITQKVENIQGTSTTTSYIYDSFNRLLREDIGGTANVYHYDQYGNLSTSDFNEVLYFYDANNRLTSIEEYGKTRDTEDGEKYDDWYTYLAYDKNGNLLRSETDACTTPYESSNYKTYTYDVWGRMTNFSDTLGESASYTYYSDGLRASKTIGTDVTKYYYNGDNVINETLNGNSYATNVLGVNGYISRQQNGTIGYLFKNAHGDVISAYSSTTNKLADYTYNAWGEQRTENETTSFTNNPLRYAGQYYDYESGMTYLRARYYDSSIRRFISEDPIRDGLNWYAYCSNNPVMFVDPTGYITEEEIQMYENGEMAPGAYSFLWYCTYQWWLADAVGDATGKAYWNSWAEEFRANGYTDTGDGSWNAVINGMSARPSNWEVSEYEHYFRNELNIEFSYDELMTLNSVLPEEYKWGTVVADFHQNHKVDGKENVKYVSGCGHFEIVFNARNEVQNAHNNTDDMGTYNYYSPTDDIVNHGIYDVLPYYNPATGEGYGNVPEAERVTP